MTKETINNIIKSLENNTEASVISAFNFSSENRNQLLFFCKPEVFFPEAKSDKIIELAMAKFSSFHVKVEGIACMSGKYLGEKGIMDKHYGFINRLSKGVSKIIQPEELARIQELAGFSKDDSFEVLGGHEMIEKHNLSTQQLTHLWNSQPNMKIRSGFYFVVLNVDNKKIALVNGFHPAQLEHFTGKDSKIVLVLLSSNQDFSLLKNSMAGATSPDKASVDSIRGEIFLNQKALGVEEISMFKNFVHLSAGPFEAAFEINNFLSTLSAAGFDFSKINVSLKAKKLGISEEKILKILENPQIVINEKSTDLYSVTEEKNTDEALEIYKSFKA